MDARVRYTKKVIKEVFLELLKNVPLEKITVTEICKDAQINRATFYKYYNNPSDLLKKLEQDRLDDLHKKIIESNASTAFEVFRIVLDDLKVNKDFYQIVFVKNGDISFRDQVFGDCYEYGMRTIQRLYPQLSEQQQKWMFAFIAEGFNGVIQDWQQHGMENDPNEIVTFVRPLVNSVLTTKL